MVENAANEFLDTLTATPMAEKVSLVTYSDVADTDHALSFDYTDIRDSIEDHTQNYAGGATNIADGIEFGRQSLANGGRAWAAKAIVVMTDGKHNAGVITPQDAAATAAGQGVLIHTITYGIDADQVVMQEVAEEGGGQHWHAPNSTVLQQVFQEIAETLPTMLME
jgi:Mg-chelatase subunit ChlD